MKIYFVRHGESAGNASNVQQDLTTSLTKKGRAQAVFVTKRFQNIPIDFIVSSTLVRARETSEIVNNTLQKPIEYIDLLVEQKRSSEIIGIPKNALERLKIDQLVHKHFHNSSWHYSDEENFEDLKKRGLTLLEKMKQYKHENILAVTHGIFMRMIIACMVFGGDLNSHEYLKILRSFLAENTGITICEYTLNEFTNDYIWTIVAWNDHAHLEEV